MGEDHGWTASGRRGSFWVGGERVEGPLGTVLRGPMYVEWYEPEERRFPVPLVLVHGGGGQGLDYLTTPDGRPGWAPLLVDQGYAVYVVDRPGHGRSPHHPDVLGPMSPVLGTEFLEPIFVPPTEGPGSHPTAHLHTQWPGARKLDDPLSDQWLASSGPVLANQPEMHALEQARLAALLDRIGPAVIVAHSAGGPGAFLAADARPHLVKAFVALEVLGPPFLKMPEAGLDLTWGIASAPFTFDPPAVSADELRLVTHEPPADGGIPMTLQEQPARRLANLSRFPIAVVSAPASPFVHFDGHLVAFLEQAGCDVALVRLADHGVHGNGHGMIIEKNNADALRVVTDWIAGL
ncbi:alpha/beta hydrolase [Streptomyces sp900105755]|uniref:Alpha/beta hydrolase n=1 Tax=Streptomyces sp. 900105755 TaxID=3154389 RepID=A0ABV1T986_9ACTN